LIGTVITAIYETKKEEEPDEEREESIFDKVLRNVKTYKFTIILSIITATTFALSVHHFAYQAGCAMAAYKILREEYDGYISSAKEVLGDKKESEILSNKVRKEIGNVTVKSTNGSTLLYEPISRTYYEGSVADVQTVEKRINDDFSNPDSHKFFYSYREFLDMLGLYDVHLDDKKSEHNLGFYKYDGPISISYNVQVLPDQSIVTALIYNLSPRYDFDW